METKRMEKMSPQIRRFADPLGRLLTDAFHLAGLFAIGAATVWAAVFAFMGMASRGQVSVEDLLLLFIYLEIGSMVGIYFKTNHMPVRFLIYVGITAVTRHLIVYVQNAQQPDLGVIYLAASTFILSGAVFLIRYTSFHYPSKPDTEQSADGNSP
jgi:protein PsiE